MFSCKVSYLISYKVEIFKKSLNFNILATVFAVKVLKLDGHKVITVCFVITFWGKYPQKRGRFWGKIGYLLGQKH